MKKLTLVLLLIASNVGAQSLPSYYPSEGFRQTAVIDLVNLDNGTIVIGDSSFQLAENVVVRTLSSADDSKARLRVGTRVAYRLNGSRQIAEIWLVPPGYRDTRGGGR